MSLERLNIELPESFVFNNRRFFRRSEIEHLKRCLIARAQGQSEPAYSEPEAESFVNASQVARELGIARRTMARRISEAVSRKAGTMVAAE